MNIQSYVLKKRQFSPELSYNFPTLPKFYLLLKFSAFKGHEINL